MAIASGRGGVIEAYMKAMGSPIRAANLCNSLRGMLRRGAYLNDELFGRVLDILVETKGEALDRHLKRAVPAG